MIRVAAAATLIVIAGCSRTTGGPLDPVVGADVQVTADPDGNRAATIRSGAVSARITARWSDTGGQSVRIAYANRRTDPVRIDLATLAMAGPAGEAVVMSVADVSDTDLLDTRTDNDDARVLLQRDATGRARGMLVLPPGAQREVDAQLSPFSNTAASAGSRIVVRIPMAATVADVPFVARRPALLPF